jgi:hypothetical protein
MSSEVSYRDVRSGWTAVWLEQESTWSDWAETRPRSRRLASPLPAEGART